VKTTLEMNFHEMKAFFVAVFWEQAEQLGIR